MQKWESRGKSFADEGICLTVQRMCSRPGPSPCALVNQTIQKTSQGFT